MALSSTAFVRGFKDVVRRQPWLYQPLRVGANRLWQSAPAQRIAYALHRRRRKSPPATTARISVVLDLVGAPDTDVAAAVTRAVGQTLAPHQIVVVSDRYAPTDAVIATVSATGSRAERLNRALERVTGDGVVVLDRYDVLDPDALAWLASGQDGTKDTVVYGDEDIVDKAGRHRDPLFKPAWNPELLRSMPYLGHATLIPTGLARRIGGFRESSGGELWDLHLRATATAGAVRQVAQIVSGTLPGGPAEAGLPALAAAATAECRADAVVAEDPDHPGLWRTTYPVVGEPLVSIVIPSKNMLDVVRRCVDSIYALTSYPTFEVVLVDTGSDDPAVWAWYAATAEAHPSFRVVEWPEQPWSYSRSCNHGAAEAAGDVLVMLNNDTEVLHADWLDILVGEAQRPHVGAVGALLYFPDGRTVQHAGVSIGINGVAGNALALLRDDEWLSRTQQVMLHTRHAMTAVTAACLAIRADLFAEVGGFDAELRVSYNDVDLCCRLDRLGHRNVYVPYARLLHHESISITTVSQSGRDWSEAYASMDLFTSRWRDLVDADPALNPNLSRGTVTYRLPLLGW
jgi:GT2 family glycosyltransferase